MTVKIDFTLSQRFGVVEKSIFRLVLNGLTDVRHISRLLWLFSDEVIANALRRLVNQQILRADLESHSLFLSDAVAAVIEICLNNTYPLDIPTALESGMKEHGLFLTDVQTKEAILAQLLPDVRLGFLAKSLDFYISDQKKEGENHDEHK